MSKAVPGFSPKRFSDDNVCRKDSFEDIDGSFRLFSSVDLYHSFVSEKHSWRNACPLRKSILQFLICKKICKKPRSNGVTFLNKMWKRNERVSQLSDNGNRWATNFQLIVRFTLYIEETLEKSIGRHRKHSSLSANLHFLALFQLPSLFNDGRELKRRK